MSPYPLLVPEPELASWPDAGWAEVSDCVADRKQTLERSSRNVEVFQSSEPQLRQWLSEKELMMKVLGPVSVDPNMLNTQKQQVQVDRKSVV